MQIITMGVNYEVTPIELRERMTFNAEEAKSWLEQLKAMQGVHESIVLATCNRTELIAVIEDEAIQETLFELMQEQFSIEATTLNQIIQVKVDEEAVQHFFRLASGLESMVLGETQILGQVRDAFLFAQAAGNTKKIFNELFNRVIAFAKQAHTQTGIAEQALSMSYLAVEAIKSSITHLEHRTVTVIGAGEMSEQALRNLLSAGTGYIQVVNRTFSKAAHLAQTYQAHPVEMKHLTQALMKSDVIISATRADEPVLTKEMIQQVQEVRHHEPLFLIDLALPRDIEATVEEVPNVRLVDIDYFQFVIDEHQQIKTEAARIIEDQIEHELISFANWLNLLDVVPVIQALRERSMKIQEKTVDSLFRKIPELTAREKKVIEKHTKSIVNQILQSPIQQVKELSQSEEREQTMQMLQYLFNLKEAQSEEVKDR